MRHVIAKAGSMKQPGDCQGETDGSVQLVNDIFLLAEVPGAEPVTKGDHHREKDLSLN